MLDDSDDGDDDDISRRSESLLCGGGEIVRAGLWGRGEVRRPIRGSLQTDGVVLHQSGSNRDGERSA